METWSHSFRNIYICYNENHKNMKGVNIMEEKTTLITNENLEVLRGTLVDMLRTAANILENENSNYETRDYVLGNLKDNIRMYMRLERHCKDVL